MYLDLKHRVRERALDVLDWVDYRPDPHWWQYLAVPAAIAVAAFVIPAGALVLLLIGTIVCALAAFTFAFATAFAVIGVRALRDVATLRPRRTARHTARPKLAWLHTIRTQL